MHNAEYPSIASPTDQDAEEGKPKRMNFMAPSGLLRRVKVLAEEQRQSQSDVIRRALEVFIESYEKEKIDREIEEACKFYYDQDKHSAALWRAAEPRP